MLPLLWACAEPPSAACAMLDAAVPGPLMAERSAVRGDPVAAARLLMAEARRTGDAGFYTLAEKAAECALEHDSADRDARLLRAEILYNFHEFAAAEREARALIGVDGDVPARRLVGDALAEQGRLVEAAEVYQQAADLDASPDVLDAIGALRWRMGDAAGAIEMFELALAGSADPEQRAFELTEIGWLHAITGAPAPEIDAALAELPGYAPALTARGRLRLHAGDSAGAEADFRAALPGIDAAIGLAELGDPGPSQVACREAPRSCVFRIADADPQAALAAMDAELAVRKDALTLLARAWAAHHAGTDARAEAIEALNSGTRDPRALLQAGLVLDNRELVELALASGPGLWPSERALGAGHAGTSVSPEQVMQGRVSVQGAR